MSNQVYFIEETIRRPARQVVVRGVHDRQKKRNTKDKEACTV